MYTSEDEDNISVNGGEGSEDREEGDKEVDILLNKWKGKQGKRKRRGRRSSWSIDIINDLVDIIVSSDVNKKKLIFENTKRVANTILYEGILKELNQRASDGGGGGGDLARTMLSNYETNSSRVCVYVKRLPLLSALLLVSPSSETTSALVHGSTSCTRLSNRGTVVNLNVVWSRC